jgi:two-component system cell cycle response regulator
MTPWRVLLVEDTFSNIKMLEAKLLNERFDVEMAFDGTEALDKLGRRSCDIVLLDVMMPGLDGFEVCRRIRREPATRGVPVIMITALDSAEDRERGFGSGADDFFVKPVDDETLYHRMRELISRA